MRLSLCALLLPVLFAATLHAEPDRRSIYVMWGSQDDKSSKSGSKTGDAAGVALMLGDLMGEALANAYPCGTTSTSSDTQAVLEQERRNQLLGIDTGAGTLASIGKSVGAATLVYFTVIQSGGSYNVSAAAIDTATARATDRKMATIPAEGDAIGALNRFAREFAASLTGIPKCPGKDWAGSVEVTYAINGTTRDGTETGIGSLICHLSGDGDRAKCTYNGKDVLAGKDATLTTVKTAKDFAGSVSASLTGGKMSLQIGSITVSTTRSLSGIASFNIDPADEELTGESFELPATGDPNSQSGSWNAPSLSSNIKINVKWSLKRASGGR